LPNEVKIISLSAVGLVCTYVCCVHYKLQHTLETAWLQIKMTVTK